MLGGSCHPCCPQPQNWYCYDYRVCGCHTNSLKPSQVNTQNRIEPRYFYAMAKFTITQPSYGRFTQLGNTYITKYEQGSFADSLNGPSEGAWYTYGGDADWPGPQQTLYLKYSGGFDPSCFQTEGSCSYIWEGKDLGGSSSTDFSYINVQLGFGSSFYFYQRIILNINCTRTGFIPGIWMEYVVDAAASTAPRPSDANLPEHALPGRGPWNAQTAGNRTRGFSRDFSSLEAAVGIGPITMQEAFPFIAQWPPQPDISSPTITRRGGFNQFRCFGFEYEVTYPLKKYSLLPDDGTKVELLTVGSVTLRIGDTALGAV